MIKFQGSPLFPQLKYFNKLPRQGLQIDHLEWVKPMLESIVNDVPDAFENLEQTIHFLRAKSLKSEATYNLFRNDVERFILWAWICARKSIINLRRSDIEEFIEFSHKPPSAWISGSITPRFYDDNGQLKPNDTWRPFSLRLPQNVASNAKTLKQAKGNYVATPEAIKATFSALTVFYDYLVGADYAYGNVIPAVKRDSPYIIKDTSIKETKRLSPLCWEYLIRTCENLATASPKHERTLFVIAAMKTLYLRISELSVRPSWTPVMGHFWRDKDKNLWLKVFGKGRKIRDISVPQAFEPYLDRYRQYRGLPSRIEVNEQTALVEKITGTGGMTTRQLRRIVQEGFDAARLAMIEDGFGDEAKNLEDATTHYLRHTGASEDAVNRPIKHLSDDLGHASTGTTDKLYIHSDAAERAASGKKRGV